MRVDNVDTLPPPCAGVSLSVPLPVICGGAPNPPLFLEAIFLHLYTFASGSSGNCALVTMGSTAVLLDAGISARRITRALAELDLTPDRLSAIVVTHEHADHVAGLAVLTKRCSVPVFASAGTARELARMTPRLEDLLRPFHAGDSFCLGDLALTSFSTPHDAADSVGYTVTDGRRTLGLITDLGCVTENIRAAARTCDTLILESNHDIDRLRLGPYPDWLKRRILSDRGHLCNEAAAALAQEAVEHGTERILLAHLSEKNNTEALARDAAAAALRGTGVSPRLIPRSACAPAVEV